MYICSAAAIPPHFISLFLASLRMRAWGFLLQVSGRAHRCGSRQVHRLRLCARSSSSAAETQPANNSLLEHYHMDRGFFRGSGLLLALSGAAVLVPTETKGDVMAGTVRTFRSLGVSEQAIPDAVLLHDHFRRNFLAMYNNALSCPTFYFLWHLIHGAGAATSAVRALTGTARVVPFLVGLYGSAACTTPFLTVGLMRRGQEYKPASKNAAAAVMLSGVAVFESLVELRGCGVAFGNMTPVAVGLFIPAIIGRLAAGVLVQQQKVGTEFQSVVPADWKAAGGARSSVYDLSTTLCIDSAFFVSVVGTTFFQHFLNGITYVSLTQGRATNLAAIGRYLTGGLAGTTASALQQISRTLGLRVAFCGLWNWLSAQPPPALECVDATLNVLSTARQTGAVPV